MQTEPLAFTYKREPMPEGMRATCPLCCRAIQVGAAGRIVRHGWQERGRKVGASGLGFQWGACPGGGEQPLEQTDEDGLRNIKKLLDSAAAWDAQAVEHTAGHDSYAHEITLRFGEQLADNPWAALEVIRTEQRPNRFWHGKMDTVITYRVPRGFEVRDRYTQKLRPGSYEALRGARQLEAEMHANQLRAAERMLRSAIAYHQVTEPSRKPEAKRAKLMHLRNHRGRAVCRPGAYTAHTTADRSLVTCPKCSARASK